jgi:hypothetical protein
MFLLKVGFGGGAGPSIGAPGSPDTSRVLEVYVWVKEV